jgi:recombination protein RecA
MDVRKIETLKKNNQVYGARIRAKIVKNKVAPPFKEAEIVITAEGIDKEEGLVDTAIANGILTKSGAFIRFGEKILGQGKEQVKETLANDEKLRSTLLKAIKDKTSAKK